MDQVLNYADLAAGQILGQFRKSKSNRSFTAEVTPFAEACQDIETLLWQLSNGNSIADSYGEQLDALGKMLGCPRNGAPDSTYRLNLHFQILLNMCWGQPDIIIQWLRLACYNSTPEADAVVLDESGDASLTITLTGPQNLYSSTDVTDTVNGNIYAQLRKIVAAGVSLNLTVTGAVAPFEWVAEDGFHPYPFGGGWGEIGDDATELTILQGSWTTYRDN